LENVIRARGGTKGWRRVSSSAKVVMGGLSVDLKVAYYIFIAVLQCDTEQNLRESARKSGLGAHSGGRITSLLSLR